MRTLIFISLLLMLASCGTQKTLAEQCAEAFPSEVIRDTITEVHWEVHNFPVPELDTMYIDTTICLPSADTIIVEKERRVYLPAKTVQAEIPVTKKTVNAQKVDSALVEAYQQLQAKYRQAITDLEVCEARYNEAGKKSSPWLPWAILLALITLAIVLAVKKK